MYGFRLGAQWSPGQNRFEDNEGFPISETVCNGGNSGPCEDGSWGTVYSLAATWENFGLKAIGAYELHKRVNRAGDAGTRRTWSREATGTGSIGRRPCTSSTPG